MQGQGQKSGLLGQLPSTGAAKEAGANVGLSGHSTFGEPSSPPVILKTTFNTEGALVTRAGSRALNHFL